MDRAEQVILRHHATTSAFARKCHQTQTIIEAARNQPHRWYAAFSGGIDSTVLLDILWQTGGPLDVLWGDDGWDYPETMTFLAETEARYHFHLVRCRSLHPWRSWCQEMRQPDLANDPAALQAWHNPRTWDYVWRSLTLDAHQAGYDGVFMGMLSSESGTRKRVLRHGWRPTYAVNTGMIHSSPLAHWNKQDIWAYVVAHGLPYNPVYDRLAALGVPLERRRIAALTCFRVMHYGSHVALQQGWPDLYNQLATLFPHVRTYS